MQIKVVRMQPYCDEIEIEDLTIPQLKCINVIERYKIKYHKVPTIREIMKLTKHTSPATIQDMLNRLSKKGYNYKEI